MSAPLGTSWATTLLNAVIKGTPRALMSSPAMLSFSGVTFNLLLGLGGVEIAGQTDTGNAYVTEADRLTIVTAASAQLNDQSLGELSTAPDGLFFGKSRVAARPVLAFGTASIEAPGA